MALSAYVSHVKLSLFNTSWGLEMLNNKCFMNFNRRLKKDVVRQLPSKQRQVIMLDPTSVKVDKTLTNVKSVLEQVKVRMMHNKVLLAETSE